VLPFVAVMNNMLICKTGFRAYGIRWVGNWARESEFIWNALRVCWRRIVDFVGKNLLPYSDAGHKDGDAI